MPSYNFKCEACEKGWTEIMGFNDSIEKCPYCESTDIHKVYSLEEQTVKPIINSTEKKPGKKVREFIEESRGNLKEYRQEMKK